MDAIACSGRGERETLERGRCDGAGKASKDRNVCYPGSIMPRKSEGTARAAVSTVRVGRTENISASLERSDLQALRRRAKRLYGGNASAPTPEGATRHLPDARRAKRTPRPGRRS